MLCEEFISVLKLVLIFDSHLLIGRRSIPTSSGDRALISYSFS